MKAITKQTLIEKFDPSLREKIEDLFHYGATHLVVFENLQMDSSWFGERTVVAVGPTCTIKGLEDVHGKWLNDLPSQRQYPTCYLDMIHHLGVIADDS